MDAIRRSFLTPSPGDQDFAQLLKDLQSSGSLRSAFCDRGAHATAVAKSADQWVGKKIDLKAPDELGESPAACAEWLMVDEVIPPSRLDAVLQNLERCCVLWRKRRSYPQLLQDDEPEAQEADAFVELVTPRALQVLLTLARHSDHHCSLTVVAARHVWPLLEADHAWRYDILALIFEWSQRSISGKALAEFAAKYPQHLQMLIEIIDKEKKEDALPPGGEE
eukprot:Skav234284  [mRNA]  locus=scaffold2271:23238:24854:+ [translate_table: standard]